MMDDYRENTYTRETHEYDYLRGYSFGYGYEYEEVLKNLFHQRLNGLNEGYGGLNAEEGVSSDSKLTSKFWKILLVVVLLVSVLILSLWSMIFFA